MKAGLVLGWLLVLFLSLCLWQEYHADVVFRESIDNGEIYKGHTAQYWFEDATRAESSPVYTNRDTPETTAALAKWKKSYLHLAGEYSACLRRENEPHYEATQELDLCREKLKKMEMP